MNNSFSNTTTFVLDKAYFQECYSESVKIEQSFKIYVKACVLSVFGLLILLFSDVSAYIGWFIVVLGFLDAVSVYYQKPWWVLRQMLSKASNSEVTLLINEQGIATTSFYSDNKILWADISKMEQTPLGFLIVHSGGRSYVSATGLSTETQGFILLHVPDCDVPPEEAKKDT
ncbi:MAG: YcxB family protein [Alteromonadaceae bacterium]|nr:YcxB family protein [Alteromonadaceae bacterium]